MDYNKLKELLMAAGNKMDSNLQGSNDAIKNQAMLSGKVVENPDYQKSPEEQAQSELYNKLVANSAAGSMSPVNKYGMTAGEVGPAANTIGQLAKVKGGIMNDAKDASKFSTNLFDAANNSAEMGENTGLTMDHLKKAQMDQSRAVDMAERLKRQAKQSALQRLKR